MQVRTLIEVASLACEVPCHCGMTGTETLAALIEWEDGRQLVVTLGQLSDMPPGRLAGASVRLVSWCLCCGSLLEPGPGRVGAGR